MLYRKFLMSRLRLCLLGITGVSLFCMSQAMAEEKAGDCVTQLVHSHVRYMPSRRAKTISGKVGIIDSNFIYSCAFKAFDKLPITLSLDTQYIGIENSTEVELPSNLTGLATDIEATLPFFHFNNTYLRLGISPSFDSHDWDFETSSFRIPSRYFLIHQPDDKWTLIAGIAVFPDFEDQVLPILGFIYEPNERLTFNITPKDPNITYMLTDKITVFAEGGMRNSEFEVDRDSSKNVVLKYKESHLGGGVQYKVNDCIRTRVSLGGVFNRGFKYRDNLGKVDIKSGLYTQFKVEIKI